MQWHYAAEGQQLGPVSDAELDALLREGKINSSTLVWREGMPDWQPLSSARPGPASPPPPQSSATKCAECGRSFPPDQLLTLNRMSICAECKPIFLQRLKEGGALSDGGGLWRQGKKIKTVSETVFPDRCVKCNAPANGYLLKRVLYWQHPAYLLLLFCNLLVLLVVVLIVRKKAVLHIGLCETHRSQRIVAIAACYIGLLGGLVALITGLVMHLGWLAAVGGLMMLVGIVWGAAKGRTIAATKIDKEKNVWVSGACKDFLNELPESPD